MSRCLTLSIRTLHTPVVGQGAFVMVHLRP